MVNITPNLRKKIQNYFKEIKSYLRNGKMPELQNNKIWCVGCSFEEFCWCKQALGEKKNGNI